MKYIIFIISVIINDYFLSKFIIIFFLNFIF